MNFSVAKVFLLLLVALYVGACMPEGFTTKPRQIGISNRKAKQIQSRRYTKHEIRRYDSKAVRWDIISLNQGRKYSPMESKRYSVNSNNRNRKVNKKVEVKRRKQQNNYRYYKDSMEANDNAEKTNFSIYDK